MIPLPLYRKLGWGDLKTTSIIPQLANKTSKHEFYHEHTIQATNLSWGFSGGGNRKKKMMTKQLIAAKRTLVDWLELKRINMETFNGGQ